MWDYDKLFAEGNIVGFKHSDEDQIHPYIIIHEKPKMKKNEDGSFSLVPNEFVKEVKCWKEFEIK